jgi:hypothetical protein
MRRENRSTDPNDKRNWALDCQFPGCGRRFRETEIVAQVAEHWNTHLGRTYGEVVTATEDKPHLYLVWIGVGPNPEPSKEVKRAWMQ